MTAAARFSLWAPVIVWAAVIFAFSSIPGLGTGLGTWDIVLRKLAHAAEFAILGALLGRALRHSWLAVAVGSIYAGTDELHQAFVSDRTASAVDWVIDTVGVAIGVYAYVLWRRRR
jgi:VanZ family protein